MKNGKTVIAIIGVVMVLVSFVLGWQHAQLSAAEKYVPKEEYNRDIDEIKKDLKELLSLILEDRKSGR